LGTKSLCDCAEDKTIWKLIKNQCSEPALVSMSIRIQLLSQCMKVIKGELDQFEEKICKILQTFLSKKVRSGSGKIIPDLDMTWPKSSGSDH
jgi:hypothetical protein